MDCARWAILWVRIRRPYQRGQADVGEIRDIRDPERHLENLGWAKVFKGLEARERYSVGMGEGKKLTDAQLVELQRMGLDNAHGVSLLL